MLDRTDRTIALTLILGATLPLLDATLLNIAIQSIGRSLGAPLTQTQWVITAYALAAAATVPLSACVGAARGWALAGFVLHQRRRSDRVRDPGV